MARRPTNKRCPHCRNVQQDEIVDSEHLTRRQRCPNCNRMTWTEYVIALDCTQCADSRTQGYKHCTRCNKQVNESYTASEGWCRKCRDDHRYRNFELIQRRRHCPRCGAQDAGWFNA